MSSSVDQKIQFNGSLMDLMIHENMHLEAGSSDPGGKIVDEIADIATGPYILEFHRRMFAEEKNYRKEH